MGQSYEYWEALFLNWFVQYELNTRALSFISANLLTFISFAYCSVATTIETYSPIIMMINAKFLHGLLMCVTIFGSVLVSHAECDLPPPGSPLTCAGAVPSKSILWPPNHEFHDIYYIRGFGSQESNMHWDRHGRSSLRQERHIDL